MVKLACGRQFPYLALYLRETGFSSGFATDFTGCSFLTASNFKRESRRFSALRLENRSPKRRRWFVSLACLNIGHSVWMNDVRSAFDAQNQHGTRIKAQ
jgi:hypothetical protein